MIPQSSVPRRSSSTQANSSCRVHPHERTIQPVLQHNFLVSARRAVADQDHADSPVKDVDIRLGPITADVPKRVPSRTHDRGLQILDLVEFPTYKHPRLKLDLQVSASIFVGGGSIEGCVRVIVDDNEHLKQQRCLGIRSLLVDLVGFEEVSGGRRAMFLALGTEVID